MAGIDVLERRIYVMADVDRYIGLHPGTARRWIDGYTKGGRSYEPVIRAQTTGDDTATWGEFVETRLLAEFRHRGASLQRLRPAVQRLREELGMPYPLAAQATLLDVEGRELVRRIQDSTQLEDRLLLVVVRSGQLMLSTATQSFVDHAQSSDGVVGEVLLDEGTVRANPVRAAGRPAIRSVPADVLAEGFRAGESAAALAELYDLEVVDVEAALRYEMRDVASAVA